MESSLTLLDVGVVSLILNLILLSFHFLPLTLVSFHCCNQQAPRAREAEVMSIDFERTLSRNRVLSRENSMTMAAVSFEGDDDDDDEDEYSQAVSVPFMWESQPGTPKAEYRHAAALASPLTPPPSYYSTSSNLTKESQKPPNLLKVLFSKRSSRKKRLPPLPPNSSSPHSSSPVPSTKAGPAFDEKVKQMEEVKEEEEEEEDDVSPIATACLGRPTSKTFNGKSRGCYSFMAKILFWNFR